MNTPLVSIIVPTFNQSDFIATTLRSISDQTFKNWECIIVDDGSTDETREIVNKIILNDNRFYFFSIKNSGVASARNFGLSRAQGDFIQFLDSDDIISINRVEKCLEIISNDETIDIVISNFKMFVDRIEDATTAFCDLSKHVLNFETVLLEWDRSFGFPMHAVFLKKEATTTIYFNERTRFKEDWIYWIDILKQNKKVYFLNEVLAFYRINPNGKHKKSNENFVTVANLIYNNLSTEYQYLFFKRMVVDLTECKNKLLACSLANDEKELEIAKLRFKKSTIFKKTLNKLDNFIKNFFFRKRI